MLPSPTLLADREGAPSKNHYRLDEPQGRKVLDLVRQRGVTCTGCDSQRFEVGDALEMGSIWPDEELGTYMVGLTCRRCGTRSGVRLHASAFPE